MSAGASPASPPPRGVACTHPAAPAPPPSQAEGTDTPSSPSFPGSTPARPGPPEPTAPVVSPAQDSSLCPDFLGEGGRRGLPGSGQGMAGTPPPPASPAPLSAVGAERVPQRLHSRTLPSPPSRCKSRSCFLPCREPRQPHQDRVRPGSPCNDKGANPRRAGGEQGRPADPVPPGPQATLP